jgi:hypothetical protein
MSRSLATAALCLVTGVVLIGCMSAAQHQQDISSADEQRLTLAAVQRNVRVGMSGAEVLSSLGSPNIISTDEQRHEVWVYDRITGGGRFGLRGRGCPAQRQPEIRCQPAFPAHPDDHRAL